MEQTKLEQIAETFKDEGFAKRIFKIKGKEELIKALEEKGLELSEEEVNELAQKGQALISSGEFDHVAKAISEGELKNISGGIDVGGFAKGLLMGLSPAVWFAKDMYDDGRSVINEEKIGVLVGFSALTLLALPTVYKGVKAAGKGIYKAGTKVYDKITGSNKVQETQTVSNE